LQTYTCLTFSLNLQAAAEESESDEEEESRPASQEADSATAAKLNKAMRVRSQHTL